MSTTFLPRTAETRYHRFELPIWIFEDGVVRGDTLAYTVRPVQKKLRIVFEEIKAENIRKTNIVTETRW